MTRLIEGAGHLIGSVLENQATDAPSVAPNALFSARFWPKSALTWFDASQARRPGGTPHTVHRSDAGLVDLLIRAGANVKAANRFGATALSLAAENGDAAIMDRTGLLMRKLMIDRGLTAPAIGRTLESICITEACE